jgi:hypothetical protein
VPLSSTIPQYRKVTCAHAYLVREEFLLTDDQMKALPPWQIPWQMYGDIPPGTDVAYERNCRIGLKRIGCSDSDYDTLAYGEARDPQPDYWHNIALPLGFILGVALAVSAVVYGVVRTIGWVIGGFAAL